ncbi:MAG TPA: cation-transporting P-type ATPase [Nitrospirota bacterium]
MRISGLSREEALKNLVTSEQGLSEDEAAHRLREFGWNEITEVKRKHLLARLAGQFTHFLAILLWIAAFLSFLSDYLHPGEGMRTLGIAIIGVIVINAVVTFIQEYRAEKALEAMKNLLPFRVRVLRDSREQELSVDEVVPGDVVLFSEGDKVPADIRIIEANDLRVNNAALTGESEPVQRTASAVDADLLRSPNIVFAGTTAVSGSGKGVVFATGMRTEFGRIAHLTGTVTPGLSPLQKEIVMITRIVAAIATVTGVLFLGIGYLSGRTFWENFLFAVGIIVANVPEGLLPTVTLALAMGSQRMAKRNALIKTLTSVETLGSVSVICTDKTGTLTKNEMTVKRSVTLGKTSADAEQRLFTTALSCNNVREVNNELKGDPTEVALFRAARDRTPGVKPNRLREFPFDAERKRMSTVNAVDGTVCVMTKGAPEHVLPVCDRCMKDGAVLPFDEALKREATTLYQSFMDQGLRVLAFSYRPVKTGEQVLRKEEAEHGMIFAGLIGLEDAPRPEVAQAIAKCRQAGIRIIMITGDASRTAEAIAREIGLVTGEPAIVEGDAFPGMSDQDLREVLKKTEVLFTRMTPKHKLRVVNILKEEGERVAVTGDGVNDAPALKRADIGIAMGLTGTDVAKEAADMVLLDDNFATIVSAIEEGRAIFENIKKFITYIFAHLTPEAVPYILYALFRIPLPVTVMQILAIDLGTETIPALALGIEPPEANIMDRPPRPRQSSLIDTALLIRSYVFLGLISTAGALFAYFYVLSQGGWTWGVSLSLDDPLVRQASTATFLGIVLMQVGNVFACRSSGDTVFKRGFFANRLIFLGIAFELLLTLFVIYHPWGNELFSTAPLPLSVWLAVIPFAVLLLFADEARKLIAKKLLR